MTSLACDQIPRYRPRYIESKPNPPPPPDSYHPPPTATFSNVMRNVVITLVWKNNGPTRDVTMLSVSHVSTFVPLVGAGDEEHINNIPFDVT